MSTINERVLDIIKEQHNGNKRAFAAFLGVAPTVIENIVGKRQGNPSYEVLVAIYAKANISADWLLLGEGPMVRNEEKIDHIPDTEEMIKTTEATLVQYLHEQIETLQAKISLLERENAVLQYRLGKDPTEKTD